MKYCEERTSNRWLLIMFLLISLFAIGIGYWITALNLGYLAWYRIILTAELLIAIIVVHSFWRYQIKVIGGNLIFGFGIFRKKIELTNIARVETVNITSKRFLNYGIYFQPSKRRIIYSASNGPAIQITVKNKKYLYIISTENPNQLKDTIKYS